MSTETSTRSHRRIGGLALLPLAAIVLGACGPAAAPAPTPPAVKAFATTGSPRTWYLGQKERPPPPSGPLTCTVGTTLSDAVEQCHLQYRAYTLDTTSPAAQNKANTLINMTPSQCSSALDTFHSGVGKNPTLGTQYPGVSMAGENLYCLYFSTGQCPGAQFGAANAMNAWLASPGHKANMDNFAGLFVNAAAVCKPTSQGGHGVYVAVAQFHN